MIGTLDGFFLQMLPFCGMPVPPIRISPAYLEALLSAIPSLGAFLPPLLNEVQISPLSVLENLFLSPLMKYRC